MNKLKNINSKDYNSVSKSRERQQRQRRRSLSYQKDKRRKYNSSERNQDERNLKTNRKDDYYFNKEWHPSRYRKEDESEFKVHFYLNQVFLNPKISIDEFLKNVRERVNKVGQSEIIQILRYDNRTKLTNVSIGMKFDAEAKQILNRKKIIYLYNKDNNLTAFKPEVSKNFQLKLNEENKNYENKNRKGFKSPEKEFNKRNQSYKEKYPNNRGEERNKKRYNEKSSESSYSKYIKEKKRKRFYYKLHLYFLKS